MMERAAEALDRVPREEREIASLTFCLPEPRMLELKAQLERFRDELMHSYTGDASGGRVVQVNMQMFPLTIE